MRKVDVTTLALIALASAFFPRILTAMGAPKILNFIHFPIILACFIMVLPIPTRGPSKWIILGMGALFANILISALLNSAGPVNVVLDFLLLVEPFLLLLIILKEPWDLRKFKRFRFGVFLFMSVHLLVASFQYFGMGLTGDRVEGVFLNMGAGSHISGAVAFAAGVYFWLSDFFSNRLARIGYAISLILIVVYGDAKQVIAVALGAVIVLIVIRSVTQIGTAIKYVALISVSILILIWAANTIFPALGTWAKVDRIVLGVTGKFEVFAIIISYYDSILNWIFGLGPGHTIGRLGWLMPHYMDVLEQFGVSSTGVMSEVMYTQESNWVTNTVTGSSMWSLFFSWAGIWGDLGILGLLIYGRLWWTVWNKLCLNETSKFYLLTILIYGMVISWLEEPGFMLSIVSFIGLGYHESLLEMSESKRKAIQIKQRVKRLYTATGAAK